MISKEEVLHIAKLARLKLSSPEVEKFSTQLSGILDYMEILKEVDTTDVKPTSQVTGLTNITQEDTPRKSPPREDLLQCSELPKEKAQIKVHSVFES
ncbi:MAG TPA: Asp-tRNA(Asn)/Glu-tRNA(Gln) amidotransferase subunit GatC [Candidatus Peregrinibacteria bacterium]|nr:Asp-tRNA(Asn)/Glu-tRNA(Gln) amidotransferase subunit GatC [Candidatus Peregrinibacteria bacterium]